MQKIIRKIFFLVCTFACILFSGWLAFKNYPELVWGLPLLPAITFFLFACVEKQKHTPRQKRVEPEMSPAEEVKMAVFNCFLGCVVVAVIILCTTLWYFGFFFWVWKNLPPILLALLFSCGIIGGSLSGGWRYKEPRP